MTSLLERQNSVPVEEQIPAFEQLRPEFRRQPNRLTRWIVAFVAFSAIGAAAVGVTVGAGSDEAAAPLTYRAVGEAEALERFASSVEPGLTYRAVGEAEALERFASSVEPGLTYRALGEAEALQRFATF